MYNLCSVGKEFQTTLLTLSPPSNGTSPLHTFEGDRSDRFSVQSADEGEGEEAPAKKVYGVKKIGFERTLEVHGTKNSPVDAGAAAWFVSCC